MFRDEACARNKDSIILMQRFNMKDGYTCYGDSGGPVMVVNDNGVHVVAAVVSRLPLTNYYSWPPECFCNCNHLPEEHVRVAAVLTWIRNTIKWNRMDIPCNGA